MAVNATFKADFSNFTAAVKQAEVRLKEMESGAGKVGVALNRMGESFSGKKIIGDALLMEQALGGVAGASKLTEAEQARVNRTLTEALAKYKALGREAPPALHALAAATRQVEAPTSKMNSLFGDMGTQLKATALGFISATAVIGGAKMAFGAFTQFLGDSVTSYAAAESAQKKMTTALQSAGRATPEVIGQMNALAGQFQQTTVYSDELTTEMQALLIQVGNVMPSQMAKAQKAAADLASGLGIDLQTATMLVGKAFAGETGTLSRYGIVIDDVKLKAEGMPAVLDAIQRKFGGQAQAELDTYAGKLKHLANVWSDFQEMVGKSIVDDPILAAGLRAVGAAAGAAGTAADGAGLSFLEMWSNIATGDKTGINARVIRYLGELATVTNTAADAARRMAAVQIPAMFAPGATAKGLDVTKFLQDQERALNTAATAAEKAAEKAAAAMRALQTRQDALFGRDLIARAQQMASDLVHVSNLTLISAEKTRELRSAMTAALEVYARMGKTAPQAMVDILNATSNLGDSVGVVKGLAGALKGVGVQAQIAAPPMRDVVTGIGDLLGKFGKFDDTIRLGRITEDTKRLAEEAKRVDAAMTALIGSLGTLAQVSGDTFGGMVRGLATVITAIETARKGMEVFTTGKTTGGFEGLLGMTTGILGMASAAIMAGKAMKGLWDAAFGPTDYEKRVRAAASETTRLQQALLSTHGGMAQLVKDAAAVGINITEAFRWQDPEALARVIEDLNEKTAALGITATATGDAQSDATRKAMDAIGALDDRIKSLSDSIAGEAPEEFMGVIEATTRAQIAAIQKERNAAQAALNDTIVSAADAADVAGNIIDKALAERLFVIRVKAEIDGLPGGQASGTGLYTPRGGGSGTGTGGDTVVQSNLYMDSLKVAEALVTLQKRVGG